MELSGAVTEPVNASPPAPLFLWERRASRPKRNFNRAGKLCSHALRAPSARSIRQRIGPSAEPLYKYAIHPLFLLRVASDAMKIDSPSDERAKIMLIMGYRFARSCRAALRRTLENSRKSVEKLSEAWRTSLSLSLSLSLSFWSAIANFEEKSTGSKLLRGCRDSARV